MLPDAVASASCCLLGQMTTADVVALNKKRETRYAIVRGSNSLGRYEARVISHTNVCSKF